MSESIPPAPVQSAEYIELPPDPPMWPKVIGILSIVFGSLGLVCIGCGGVGLIMQVAFAAQSEEAMGGPMPDAMKVPMAQIAMMPIGAILAALLLIAGIMLLKRNHAARMLHLVYSVINIITTIASTIVGIQQIGRLEAWIQDNPDSKWAQMAKPEMQLPILIGTVALSIAYPLFCLVWFGLVKRKGSDIGTAREVL